MSRSVEAQGLAALLNLDAHLEMGRIHAAAEQAAATATSTAATAASGSPATLAPPGQPAGTTPSPPAPGLLVPRPTAGSGAASADGAAMGATGAAVVARGADTKLQAEAAEGAEEAEEAEEEAPAGIVVDEADSPAASGPHPVQPSAARTVKGMADLKAGSARSGQPVAAAADPATPPAGSGVPASAQPPSALGRIGPYELKAQVAHDGLGQIFKAWDSTDNVEVMLTLLDLESDARDRDVIVAQLHRSVLAAAALQHPGLAHIHDAGVVGAGVYIVNHWLPGRTLAHALLAGWQPTARVAATMVRNLALALACAHGKGVLHGGLNPSTVMLDAEDKPTVLGLGYACPAHASDLPSMDPLVSGAAPYLAPEQLQGGAVDARTDVHALGVLLYELLAGHRAYPGETVPEVARALMAHDPAPPHWLRLDVPERLSAIAMQALQRNPAARYAQASDMAQALDAWLEQVDQENDDAREAFVAAQAQPPVGGRRKSHWVTAGLVAAAAVVVAFSWVDSRGPDTVNAGQAPAAPAGVSADPPTAPTGGDTTAPLAAASAVVLASATSSAVAGDALQATPPAANEPAADTLATMPAAAAVVALAGAVAPDRADAQPESPGATRAAAAAAPALPVARALPADAKPALPATGTKVAAPASGAAKAGAPAAAAKTAPRDKPRPPASDARPPAAPAAVATGTVQLAVSPWGYVDVGGKPVGASPPLQKLTLPEGTHTITIRNEDFAPYVTTIQVSAEKSATVRHRFSQ